MKREMRGNLEPSTPEEPKHVNELEIPLIYFEKIGYNVKIQRGSTSLLKVASSFLSSQNIIPDSSRRTMDNLETISSTKQAECTQ